MRCPNLNDGIRGYIDGDLHKHEPSETDDKEWRNHMQLLDSGQLSKRKRKCNNCGATSPKKCVCRIKYVEY